MKDKVRLALVGCGWIAGAHIDGYEQLVKAGCKETMYTACCDMNEAKAKQMAERIAAIQGTTPAVFKDVQSLIKAHVADGADVCLPHFLHHSVGCELLEGGIHTMIEKPLGLTIRASRLLIDTAKVHDLILATAENTRRTLNSRAWAWAMRDKKLIGDCVMATISCLYNGPFDYSDPVWKWRGLKLIGGGGMIMDSGAHFCDMQRVLFGEPVEISCWMTQLDNRTISDGPVVGTVPTDVEDTWHATFRFKNGVRVIWSYGRQFCEPILTHAHYYGTHGTVQELGFPMHSLEGGAKATLADGKAISNDDLVKEYLQSLPHEKKDTLFPYGCTHSFGIEIWDFANAIRTGGKPEMDGEEGMRSKALCIACYESAVIGKPVLYNDVLQGKHSVYQDTINDYWQIRNVLNEKEPAISATRA